MQIAQLVTHRSLDELESDIIHLAARINSLEYDFLELVREFDLRQGWKAYHFNNCAEWLNMKCGLAPGTAREKIRVANALFHLPLTAAAFQGGNLSYSKARALTRVATPETEEALVAYAVPATAQQVDDHCRKLRNVSRGLSGVDARRVHNERYLSRSIHPDGSVTISAQLSLEHGELLMRALDRAADVLGIDEPSTEQEESNFLQQQADALVEMAKEYLAGEPAADGNTRRQCSADHYQVMVHVDEKALRGRPDSESQADLPIETVRRLCCDGALVAVTEDDNGNPLHVGRKHRVVQPALKRALIARDKRCRFPGCTHERWLDAHHVVHWAEGGETSLDNTVLLCSKHHRLLHEGGFRMTAGPRGDWQFLRGG